MFLAMFDMPDVAQVFCPEAPEHSLTILEAIIVQAQIKRLKAEKDAASDKAGEAKKAEAEAEPDDKTPQAAEIRYIWRAEPKAAKIPKTAKKPEPVKAAQPEPDDQDTPDPSTESNQAATEEEAPIGRHLPPIYELIENGKVLALNMPAGIEPGAGSRRGRHAQERLATGASHATGQDEGESPSRYFRPAVFICDEYQAFASVGEDDPSGDEKSFALTRQCRCIPIVATQSISSLRAVLGIIRSVAGAVADAPHPNLPVSERRRQRPDCQSELCGQVAKIKAILHHQRDLQAGGSLPALRPRRRRRRRVWARPNHSGSNARPCFTRETSPCSRTVKRSVSPMTGRSRLNRAAST